MHASRVVYIVIFLMACLPILYFTLRGAGRKSRSKRAALLAAALAGVAAAGFISFGLWRYTIDTQPALVAQRFAQSLTAALGETSAAEHIARMERAGLLTDGGAASQEHTLGALRDAGWPEGSAMRISKKAAQDERGDTWYLVSSGGEAGVAVTLVRTGYRWRVSQAAAVPGEAIGGIDKELGFSDIR
ncbi:MAG: hypothetical protein GX549_04225 [Clostridiales bacterium]|nr:hypothetical protein [Clostridiales bacterium]